MIKKLPLTPVHATMQMLEMANMLYSDAVVQKKGLFKHAPHGEMVALPTYDILRAMHKRLPYNNSFMGYGETIVALNNQTGRIDGLVMLNELQGEDWSTHLPLFDQIDQSDNSFMMKMAVHIAPGAECEDRLAETLAALLRTVRYTLVATAQSHADSVFWRKVAALPEMNNMVYSFTSKKLMRHTHSMASRILLANHLRYTGEYRKAA